MTVSHHASVWPFSPFLITGCAQGAGIVVDVFALPAQHIGLPAYLDLASITPLARATGGRVALYPATQQPHAPKASAGAHPLTRDVHRAVSGPCALHATLRLRCSPELRPAHAYGCFVEHSATGMARGEEVHLLGACGCVSGGRGECHPRCCFSRALNSPPGLSPHVQAMGCCGV
jgi:hypothetical protein